MNNLLNLTIGVVGYRGKMGQEIINILKNRNIKYITEGGEFGGDKTEIFKQSDVIIDFTSAEGLNECLDFANKYKKPLVSGSTPMNKDLMQKMLEISKNTKICWSSNTSIGIAIVKKISKFLGEKLIDYDCEIFERHHNKKKDSPSGTAISLGMAVADGRKIDFEKNRIYGRTKERKNGEIGFSSIRGGNIFGDHEVMFIGENDEITISHKAFNRTIFAFGAINLSLKLLEKKDNGFYRIEDLIF